MIEPLPIIKKKDIGSRIRSLRRRRDLSQSVLAEQTDLTESYISMIETGKKLPSVSSLAAIAAVLGTSMDYIVLGTDPCNTCAGCELLSARLSHYSQEDRQLLRDLTNLVKHLSKHPWIYE